MVTGEAVTLELGLAKLPSRVLAIVIDLVPLVVALLVLFFSTEAFISGLDQALATAIVLVILVGFLVGIPVLVESLTRGRSLGKLVMGIRVVRDDGGPIRFRHAVVRGLAGFFVDFYVTFGVGAVVCSLLNERGKRVGDLLAGTVVVRVRTPSLGRPLPPMPPQLAVWATALELSRLPDELALAARSFLTRSHQLSPQVRERMAASLASAFSQAVTPPPPMGTPAWAYLAAVLAERGRRESQRFADLQAGRPNGFDLAQSARSPTPSGQPPADWATPAMPPEDRRSQGFAPPG